MDSKTYAVIGGDLRQCYLANSLSDEGHHVVTCGLEQSSLLYPRIKRLPLNACLETSQILILPLPASSDGITVRCEYSFSPIYLADIFAGASHEAFVTGGKLSQNMLDAAKSRGFQMIDYLEREELSVLNAIPTAEGALQIAMENTAHTIFGSKCLVAGYGRIGKVLARMLRNLGAKVTVSARKFADLAWIKAEGMQAVHSSEITSAAAKADVVFNTVPFLLFDEEALSEIANDCLIIDLASAPGGVDFDAAALLGHKAIQALSLPGKVAPKAAAEIIKTTIHNILVEEETKTRQSLTH